MRAGEVTGLLIDDVDVTRGLVTVRRGKGGKGRLAPFGPQTARAIDRYLRARAHPPTRRHVGALLGDRGKGLGYYGLWAALKHRAIRGPQRPSVRQPRPVV
jgi:site-specific recombinase XerD